MNVEKSLKKNFAKKYEVVMWKVLLIKQSNHFLNRVMILSSDKIGFHSFLFRLNLSTALNMFHFFF